MNFFTKVGVMVGMLVAIFGCAQHSPENNISLVNNVKIESINFVGSDHDDPYKLVFRIRFSRSVDARAMWRCADKTMHCGHTLIREGIAINNSAEEGPYVKIVTLEMRTVQKITGTFGGPIVLYIGCNQPSDGYPNYRPIDIGRNMDIPESERWKYFEATPLRIIIHMSNNETIVYTTKG